MKKISILLILFMVAACTQAEDQEAKAKEVKVQAEQVKAEAKEIKAEAEQIEEKVKAEAKQAVDSHAGHAHDVVEDVAKQVIPEAVDYQAGIHYSVLNPAWDTETDEVVVYEFFGYLCPHCYSFQPYMTAFEQRHGEKVKLVRVPVVFQPIWKIYAQAYYTAESMGVLEKTHNAFFEAIHQHRKQFRTIEQIAQWYSDSFGVDKDKFLSTANSFMVDGMVRKGDQMMRQMQIQSTPTLVVNGQFKPNGKQLRTRDDVMNVVDYLIAEEMK